MRYYKTDKAYIGHPLSTKFNYT